MKAKRLSDKVVPSGDHLQDHYVQTREADLSGSSAEPTCVVGDKRRGEEVDIAIGESRVSQAADEGQSHWRRQRLHGVHVGINWDGC